MVDPDRVGELLVAAQAYLDDERGEQYQIGFPLQQAIQIAIDLDAHLLADTPRLANRLAALARFRNLLVHRYAELEA